MAVVVIGGEREKELSSGLEISYENFLESTGVAECSGPIPSGPDKGRQNRRP